MEKDELDLPPLTSIEIPDKRQFKIGEVAKLLDLEPYTLRYWEQEFEVLAPAKTDSGQRAYERWDIELLATIRELLYEEMFTIDGARRQLELCRKGEPSYLSQTMVDGEPEAPAADEGGGTEVDEKLRGENEQLREDNAQMAEELRELRDSRESLVEQRDALHQKVDRLAEELEEARQAAEEAAEWDTAAVEEWKRTAEQLEAETEALEKELHNSRQKVEQLRSERDQARREARQAEQTPALDPKLLDSVHRELDALAQLGA